MVWINKAVIAGLMWLAILPWPAVAQFGSRHVVSSQAIGAARVYAADLDNDGDEDIISASSADNKIAWFENLDGYGSFGSERIISTASVKVYALHVADIDGDGNQDVLSASQGDNVVAWYRNSGGGSFDVRQIVSSEAFVAQSVFAADIDMDGDLDVLSASRDDDRIAWYENTDGAGVFGPLQVISSTAERAHTVFAADLDGDGDPDVLSASELDDKIAWYENTDGAGAFSGERILSSNANAARDVLAADLDGDGDMDVLSAAAGDNKISWHRNKDGAGDFTGEIVITTSASFVQDIHVADIDLDGDLDVLSASTNDSKIAWYPNLDGAGTFGPQKIIDPTVSGAVSVFVANLDGDDDLDVLSASSFDNEIAWYESFAGPGRVRFGVTHTVSEIGESYGAHAVHASDLDGDGDLDVLSASYNDSKIAWYPNDRGEMGEQRVISAAASGARDVAAADIDGDGDNDVISASGGDNAIKWYENIDGLGSFDGLQVITINAENAYAVHTDDLDGDGDIDVLSASFDDNTIAWYENLDGKGTFSELKTISKATQGAIDVFSEDIDGDGDPDVVAASSFDGTISWFENQGGVFGQLNIITEEAKLATAVHVADLDGDGDLDVVSASSEDHKIAWYENEDGRGTFGVQRMISNQAYRAFSVVTADLDTDGDEDVLSASRSDNKIAWYENMDSGRFGPQQVITSEAHGARSVYAADIDGDGDPDVLSASQDDHVVAWYENFNIVTSILDTEEYETPPSTTFIGEAYPNPFLHVASIDVRVERAQHVRASVWNIQGQRIADLDAGVVLAGRAYSIRLESGGWASGIYLIRIEGETFAATRKVVLVR